MCRYLKSFTTRLFSRQLFHGSWRPLLVLCMWSTVTGGFPSRPVMWEAFRCDDSIIINLHFPVRIWSKMAQTEIILSAAILDGLVTKMTDVLRTVFSSYFVDIKCSCLVSLWYAPSPIENKPSLMPLMVRCLAHMHQEGFISLTDICQTSTGINTRISIRFLLKQWDVITHACRESNVEVKASIMDSQKVIPLHCA